MIYALCAMGNTLFAIPSAPCLPAAGRRYAILRTVLFSPRNLPIAKNKDLTPFNSGNSLNFPVDKAKNKIIS
jgi:hypothetical protein